ncbi:MAG: hypothetical protein AAFP70_06960 [Calditrichota bacterium]
MKTILDDAKTWFLHGVVYQDELYVIVIEGFVGEPTEEITIADYTIKDLSPIEISKDSRTMAVRFPHFVAWQVVDESYSSSDEYENHEDSGKLSTLSRSKYLDYVRDNHGWFWTGKALPRMDGKRDN